MTPEEIKTAVEDLIQLVEAGKSLQAIEKYYHPDILKWEAGEELRGIENVLAHMKDFEDKLSEVREDKSLGYQIGTGVASIVWKLDADHAEYGHMDFTEIAVQYWSEGKVIKEYFHYAMEA